MLKARSTKSRSQKSLQIEVVFVFVIPFKVLYTIPRPDTIHFRRVIVNVIVIDIVIVIVIFIAIAVIHSLTSDSSLSEMMIKCLCSTEASIVPFCSPQELT